MAQIKMVVLLSDGMVLAFDERGEQVPECQGRLLVVREKLRDLVGDGTRFYIGVWGTGILETNRECFFSECWDREAEEA